MGKSKDKSQREKPKGFDLKSLLLGSPRETTVPGSRFPNGTQSLVPVVDIRQGVLITEDGRYVKALKDISLRFRGSSNQRLIDLPASIRAHTIVPWQ